MFLLGRMLLTILSANDLGEFCFFLIAPNPSLW
jgi:hypothetical protein